VNFKECEIIDSSEEFHKKAIEFIDKDILRMNVNDEGEVTFTYPSPYARHHKQLTELRVIIDIFTK